MQRCRTSGRTRSPPIARCCGISCRRSKTGSTRTPARDFAVLGDFNRTLLREPPADSRTYRTRLDGSAAGDPLGRCTMARSGNRWVAQCPTRTRALFPELNDGRPPGAVLWRARFAGPRTRRHDPQGVVRRLQHSRRPRRSDARWHRPRADQRVAEAPARAGRVDDARGELPGCRRPRRCAAQPTSRCRRIIARTSSPGRPDRRA